MVSNPGAPDDPSPQLLEAIHARIDRMEAVESIHKELSGMGYSFDGAWAAIERAKRLGPVRGPRFRAAEPINPAKVRRAGRMALVLGGAMGLLGVGASVASWAAAGPDGTFYVWTGLILIGGAMLAAGVIALRRR